MASMLPHSAAPIPHRLLLYFSLTALDWVILLYSTSSSQSSLECLFGISRECLSRVGWLAAGRQPSKQPSPISDWWLAISKVAAAVQHSQRLTDCSTSNWVLTPVREGEKTVALKCHVTQTATARHTCHLNPDKQKKGKLKDGTWRRGWRRT